MREDEKWLCTFEISPLGDIIDVQFLGQDFNLIRKGQAALMEKIRQGTIPKGSVAIIFQSVAGLRCGSMRVINSGGNISFNKFH